MPDPSTPETPANDDSTESFDQLLSQYERSHAPSFEGGNKQLEGTVIAVTPDAVLLDIGYKTEGILPLSAFAAAPPNPGDKLLVTVKGRDPEGYYELSRLQVRQPTDWDSLEKAFADKATISGMVTAVVKGGLSVDVGVRAFMPASRSGTRDAAELEKLVGQEIRCRITKLEVTDENVVVDRRIITEEEERSAKEQRVSDLKEGDTVHGTVRSLADYGAFVDIGGVDGLLHVSDISWSRVSTPADVLSVGQQIEARILKIEPERNRISLGIKQLQPHPWDSVAEKYRTSERVRGAVTRVTDFGAFVELEPGIEGLIHVSEMSWVKKVRKPSDLVKPGDVVEAMILAVNVPERRLSLGLKQALGDPWADAPQRFAAGTVVEGPITSITRFGAFVHVSEGVEGMVHISEITAEKRINHPQDVLKLGQIVKAQVVAVDKEKRQLRLSMKQLIPTSFAEYVAEHKPGDLVSGRVVEQSGDRIRVELGEGIYGTGQLPSTQGTGDERSTAGKVDLSSLGSMLQARWKGTTTGGEAKLEAIRVGQVRSFRIARLDPASETILLELVR